MSDENINNDEELHQTDGVVDAGELDEFGFDDLPEEEASVIHSTEELETEVDAAADAKSEHAEAEQSDDTASRPTTIVSSGESLAQKAKDWVADNKVIAGSVAAAIVLSALSVAILSGKTPEPSVQFADAGFDASYPEVTRPLQEQSFAPTTLAAKDSTTSDSVVQQSKVQAEQLYEGALVNDPQKTSTSSLKDEEFEELKKEFEAYRNSVANVSQEELDMFLIVAKENRAAIAQLRNLLKMKQSQTANAATEEQVKQLMARIETLEQSVKEHGDTLVKHGKNQGWYSNRLARLEGKKVPAVSKGTKKTTAKKASGKQPTQQSEAWTIRGISYDRAFIKNKDTGAKLKVLVGTQIPGFGTVVSFDAKNERVYTTAGVIL